MPIDIGFEGEKIRLFPTAKEQKMKLKKLSKKSFQIYDNQFYVKIKEDNQSSFFYFEKFKVLIRLIFFVSVSTNSVTNKISFGLSNFSKELKIDESMSLFSPSITKTTFEPKTASG